PSMRHSLAEHGADLGEHLVELFLVLGLEVEAEERFGVALADVAPPAFLGPAVDGDAVELVDIAGLLERLLEMLERAVLVFDIEIDLARLEIARDGLDEFAQRLAVVGHDGEDAAHRDDARIGVEVVLEVEMAGELAAEDGLVVGHGLLEEYVPDAGT